MDVKEVKSSEEKVVKEENSKPNFMMRLAGGIIDTCIIFLLFYGLYTLFMITPLADGFNNLKDQMVYIQEEYKLESGYGAKYYVTSENYESYQSFHQYKEVDENNNELTYVILTKENFTEEEYNAYLKLINSSKTYENLTFDARLINYGICVLSGVISSSICLLFIPLLNKKRDSLGDLASGQCVFSVKYQNYARWYHILIRYFFMLIIDMALPYLFMELTTFIVIPLLILLITLFSKSGRSLHDLVSGIKKIDYRSFTPLVEE